MFVPYHRIEFLPVSSIDNGKKFFVIATNFVTKNNPSATPIINTAVYSNNLEARFLLVRIHLVLLIFNMSSRSKLCQNNTFVQMKPFCFLNFKKFDFFVIPK